MATQRGMLDITGYLAWYKHLVEEENAPQYIGRSMYRINPVRIMDTARDEEYGDEYLIQTADGAVNAVVPVRFVRVID